MNKVNDCYNGGCLVKKVLCIVGSMDAGGAETFLMKMYRTIDKTKYQMDFGVTRPGIYDEEIKRLGGKIHIVTPKTKGMYKSFKSIRDIVRENNYKYVMRISQNSISSIELYAAKRGGASRTIYRSSNSQACGGKIESIMHKLCLPLSKHIPDMCIAPSTEAAEFMFGKNCVVNGKAHLLHNAIDLNVYTYKDEWRKEARKELGVENKFVLGHVGRFNIQKNHSFLIDVFAEIHKRIKDTRLVLVGTGELTDSIKTKVKELDLEDAVIFSGMRKDIPQILCAMDIFVFPSLFEGLPNTVVEAQATGLPCIISDKITREAKITQNVFYLPIDNVNLWCKKIAEIMDDKNILRKKHNDEFKESGYDIESAANKFVQLVFGEE